MLTTFYNWKCTFYGRCHLWAFGSLLIGFSALAAHDCGEPASECFMVWLGYTVLSSIPPVMTYFEERNEN